MDERIELSIDGAPCALDAVPPELKAHVQKSIAAARAAAEKAGAGKATLRINIKRGQGTAIPPIQENPALSGGPAPSVAGGTIRTAVFLAALAALLILLAMKLGFRR